MPALGIGTSVCALGDVDGDGCDDFVMGCVETSGRGFNVVVSGRTGAYLHYCYGELYGDALFGYLSRLGDMDGDGVEDFVASSYGSSLRRCLRGFSGRTGAVLFGWVLAPLAAIWNPSGNGCDLDGDAIPDWIIGTDEVVSPQQRGKVYAFSGRDGSLLHELRSQGDFGRIGACASALPGPVGEHTGLLLVPDYQAPIIQGCCTLGSVTAYRGLPRTAQLLGAPCTGTLLSTPNIGMQSLGAAGVRVHVSDAPAGAPSMLLLGLSTTQIFATALPLALDPLGFSGCALYTSIDATKLVVTGTAGQASGYAAFDVPIAVPSSGLGSFTVSAQWLVLGLGAEYPGGLTQAATWRR